jgi:23S rRNA (adenine2503-C2)-methyltransferase
MRSEVIVLKSREDDSVNFVQDMEDGGKIEARFVQRSPDYFIVYLSSHTGCNKSCRFCHLTATGQTTMTPVSLSEYISQGRVVLSYYKRLLEEGHPAATKVHFNFMARGEPLSNPNFLMHSNELFNVLGEMAEELGLEASFKVSSIIPDDFNGDLEHVLRDPRSMLYYSLYSMDAGFRKRWLPKSMNPFDGLARVKQYQMVTNRPVALHWAFIKGENDSRESVEMIHTVIRGLNLKVKFNVVRYNPFNEKSSETPEEEIQDLFKILEPLTASGQTSRIVPRVGFDVKASCGMFVK